jgi:hypothetical protein
VLVGGYVVALEQTAITSYIDSNLVSASGGLVAIINSQGQHVPDPA